MDISTQIVPAAVVLVANLLSGKQGTLRWEIVTTIFGWTACVSLVLALVVYNVTSFVVFGNYLLQISGFCLLTALSRDYERILRPLFRWNRSE